MTDFVLRTALAQCRQWQDAGHHLSVAVNLSARSLLDADLVDDIARALARVGRRRLEAGPGDHRDERHVGRRVRDARPQPPLGDGAHARDRRLRHRLLVAVVPQAPAGRRGQDRQVVRPQHAGRRERRRHRPLDHRPGAEPRPAGRRRRRRDDERVGRVARHGLRHRAGLLHQPAAARRPVRRLARNGGAGPGRRRPR